MSYQKDYELVNSLKKTLESTNSSSYFKGGYKAKQQFISQLSTLETNLVNLFKWVNCVEVYEQEVKNLIIDLVDESIYNKIQFESPFMYSTQGYNARILSILKPVLTSSQFDVFIEQLEELKKKLEQSKLENSVV